MKRNLILLAAACAVAGLATPIDVRAAVTLPYTESFPYPEGNLIAQSGGTWILGNGSSTFEIAVSNSAALTAPAGFPAASGKGVRRAPSGTARRAVIQYTSVPAVDGNTMYVSFLLNVQTAPASAQSIGYLDNNSSSQGSAQANIFLDNGPKVGISKKGSAPTFTMANNLSAGTHLVVVRYQFQAGNDRVDLWVDPLSSTYGAAVAPASLGNVTGSSDPPSLDYFQISTPSSSAGAQFIDEVRLGTTWADVVPGNAAAGVGAKLGFTTQPSDTQVAGIITPAVVVQIQDTNNLAVASNNVPITLTRTSGSGTLYGTTTQNTDSSGKATFNDLYIDTVGTGNELTATASGIGTGLTSAISGDFDITSTPVITGMALTSPRMQPQGFVFDGQNGVPGAFCQVLATTDLNDTNWIIVSYQNFNGSGDITFTNPVSPAMPNVYYRLRTGDTTTKIQAPSIGIPPQSEIVSPGATAVFTVTATGPLLQYLWYFNGNPIAGATGSTLTINNAQAGNIGNYYVTVANPAGSISSAVATLGVGNVGPTIVNQPQSQTVFAGGTAIFTVNATGTSPLSYQWYFNSSNLLSGKTTAHLTLTGVTTNDAGYYSVVVSNAFNTATSTNTLLDITPVPTALPDTNMVGYAATFGVTGGAGGSDVFVSDYASLRAYCRQAGPLIIHIQGTITANENYCYVDAANKTIVGDGTNAQFFGDLRLSANNIIVQNLYIHSDQFSDADAITVDTSGHGTGQGVWIDHCTLYDCRDGSVDVTKGADFVTISWCKFYYAPVAPGVVNHEFVNLLGSSDSEPESAGKLHVTFHHNWYSDYCRERMPSVRYGRAHVFNNYYDCAGNNYCVRTRLDAQVLVENNYYLGVQNPWEKYVKTRSNGLLHASGNITNNCVFSATWTSDVVLVPGTDVLSDMNPPPYSYTLDPADVVPYYVQTYAGSGKYPFAP